MVVIVGLIIAFILMIVVCNGNIALGFVLTITLVAIVVASELSKDKEQATKSAPTDENHERTIYDGLYKDWQSHKEKGNHFVPSEYVEYFERSEEAVFSLEESAWECWAKARTSEILIAKGYQPRNMKCLSEYDQYHKCRIDHSTHSALYEDFNAKYLPLIKFYNETGEFIKTTEELPTVIAQKQARVATVLDDWRIDSSGIPKTPTGRKKYYDTIEILNDIRIEYGESKYRLYYDMVSKEERTKSKEQVFYLLCNICEKKEMLNIIASEQKYQDVSAKLSEVSSTGSWTCPECGKVHSGTEMMCACRTSKYKAIELQFFKEIEDLLGKDTRDKVKEKYDYWCKNSGRLSALNKFYQRYEIVRRAISENNPNIISDSVKGSTDGWYDYLFNRTHIGEEKALQILCCKFMTSSDCLISDDIKIY